MASKGASIQLQIEIDLMKLWLVDQFRTRTARQKLTLFQTTTTWAALTRPVQLHYEVHLEMWCMWHICWVMKGPIFAWWCSSPRRLMAAHNFIFHVFSSVHLSTYFHYPMCFVFWIDVFSQCYTEISFLSSVSYVLQKGASVLQNCN